MLITLIFSRFFDFNFIIQYWSFIFVLFYYTVLLFVIWAVVSAVAAFLTLWTHVLLFCSVFSDIVLCFQNKLMMMMTINQILHVGSYPGYLSWFQVSLRSVEKCWSCKGSKFRPFHWLGTSLIQLLVATAQVVIINMYLICELSNSSTWSIDKTSTWTHFDSNFRQFCPKPIRKKYSDMVCLRNEAVKKHKRKMQQTACNDSAAMSVD